MRACPKAIAYSRDALKILSRLDRRTAARIVSKIEQLAAEPESLANNVTALKGDEGFMRLRLGDWRVIYHDGVVLQIIRVAPRGSAYD